MTRFLRISEITRPNGHFSKSKLYKDARAGLIELRKVGAMTIVTEPEFQRYVAGKPLAYSNSRHAA